jgi:nitrate reductase gamma subunit
MSAILAFCLIVVSLLIELGGCLTDLGGFDYGILMIIEIVAGSTILLLAVGGMGEGKLWAINFFRAMTRVATGIYLAIVVCGLYLLLYARATSEDSVLAAVILIVAIIQLPLLFVIYRALARVRWLDPKSLPHEWEPPVRQNNTAPSGNPPKRGFFGWLFTCISILAITFRYYIGIFRMQWFQAWMSSGDLRKEFATIVVLLVPVLIAVGCFATRRAAFWRRRIARFVPALFQVRKP